MIFSFNWIKEFIDTTLTPAELSERLTMAGVEVEAVESLSGGIKGVVSAEVSKIAKHPNAERLSLCEVRTDKETYPIVCGATNMKSGDKVALALHNARLPGGVKLKRSKIRGVVSEGMLCSEVELGLADKSEGIMILAHDTPLGVDIVEVLELDDYLLEVGITPNRADCLSVRGLAREVAAVIGSEFIDAEVRLDETGGDVSDKVSVEIEAPELCRRYSARFIEGVKIAQSPPWLKTRLERHGIRSINNVVDATNYVLLEYGQPLHAFDYDKLSKGGDIKVRRAKPGEKITTIDGIERELADTMLVIADSERPQALAGIMGAENSEVTAETTRILLESACFDPAGVRKSSRAVGLSSDSSYRFERGVDAEGVTLALDRVASLITSLAGGTLAKGRIDVYPGKVERRPVEFTIKGLSRLLGVELEDTEVVTILKRLGMELEGGAEDGGYTATLPSYRDDVLIEADIAEEVARIKGYDEIPVTMPKASLTHSLPSTVTDFKKRIKEILVGEGMLEVINYSFTEEAAAAAFAEERRGQKPLRILNPLTEEQSVMRRSLLPSLISNLELNLSRSNEDVSIFELRPVYLHPTGETTGTLPHEKWLVSALVYGLRDGLSWNNTKEYADFYDLKGAVERLIEGIGGTNATQRLVFERTEEDDLGGLLHPGKSARVFVSDPAGTKNKKARLAGFAGELHPDITEPFETRAPACAFELDVEALGLLDTKCRAYTPLSRYPASSRDVAFVIDETVPYGEISEALEGMDTKLIENIELFDVYYGGNVPEGKRSLAIRVVYRDSEKTLKQVEVEQAHASVIELLKARFGAEIRM